jgi:hypothetical protein
MEKFGEVLGWIAAVCFFIAVSNIFVKGFFKNVVVKMPKSCVFRSIYQYFMKLVVRYHRYFGMAAGTFALVHLCWQTANVRVSYSGIFVAALMAVTAVLGIAIAYGRKADIVKIHRPAALIILAAIIFHMITKI